MSRRPLVWRGSEALKTLAVRPKTDGNDKAEGAGDGKMTKNQLKKLEKQRQIEAKKAAKAKEKEAARAASAAAAGAADAASAPDGSTTEEAPAASS